MPERFMMRLLKKGTRKTSSIEITIMCRGTQLKMEFSDRIHGRGNTWRRSFFETFMI